MHFPYGNGEIDANREGSRASEESRQDKNAAGKLGNGGDITEPARKSEAGNVLREMVQASEDLVVAVSDHDEAQSQTHENQGKRLKAIEIAQSILLRTEGIDYRRQARLGDWEKLKEIIRLPPEVARIQQVGPAA